jgi:hypothetical protein
LQFSVLPLARIYSAGHTWKARDEVMLPMPSLEFPLPSPYHFSTVSHVHIWIILDDDV